MKSYFLLAAATLMGAAGLAAAQSNVPAPSSAPQGAKPANEADRIATFTSQGREVQMVVNFGRPMTDGAVAAVLSQANAKPYRVFMVLGGMAGTHSVPVQAAGQGVLAEAREASVSQVRGALDGYDDALEKLVDSGKLESADERRVAQLRDSLERQDRDKEMLAGFSAGRPIVYAVQVVAPADAVERLRKSAQVTEVTVAYQLQDGRVVVPTPKLPSDYVSGRRPTSHQGKSREEVIGLVKARRAGQ